MTPLFIFSPPRHRGDLLVRILNGTPGVRCAGNASDFLARLRRLHAYRAALLRDHPGDLPAEGGDHLFQRFLHHSSGDSWDAAVRSMLPVVCDPRPDDVAFAMRDIESLTGEWDKDATFLSWLQFLEPKAKLLFLKREQGEFEISVEMTHKTWIPKYGGCAGKVLRRVKGVWDVFDRYHRLNPESTAIMDSGELLEAEAIKRRLGRWGIPFSRESWDLEIQRRPGNATEERLKQPVDPVVAKYGFDRLPVQEIPERPDLCVFTLRYGEAEWMGKCAASLQHWCGQHELPLRVWGEVDPADPAPKFGVVNMLREFVLSGQKWMMYVDADVLIHPLAPLPDLAVPGMHIMPDLIDDRRWESWVKRYYGVQPTPWVYRNAGVWACDRESAIQMLKKIRKPYIEGMMEQHQWNYWMMQAHADGMRVIDLPHAFNTFTRNPRPGWFFHLAGGDKMKKLRNVQQAGLVPTEPEPVEELPAPELDRAIVYPWAATKAKWQELVYSLRSVEKYFADQECPIIILADRAPTWIKEGGRVKVMTARRYDEALRHGLQLAKKVLWMNDDLYFRQPCGWEDFAPGSHYGTDKVAWAKSTVPCQNSWRKGLRRIVRDLHHHGVQKVFSFSTHTPYVYEWERAMPVLRRFGIFHKIPFETAYFNWHSDLPRRRYSGNAMRQLVENHQGDISPEDRKRIAADLRERAAWEL